VPFFRRLSHNGSIPDRLPDRGFDVLAVPTTENPRVIVSATLAVTIGTLLVMIATEPSLAIVWDEGYTLGREARVRQWIRGWLDPATMADWRPPPVELVQPDDSRAVVPPPRADQIESRSELLSHSVLLFFWPFGREEPHGHPPFYAIVGLIGDLLAPGWEELPRARLGPMLVFSLTAGAIFLEMARRFGLWSGAAAAGAWVFHPHLFAHGHYATVDAILSGLWVLAVLAFARASRAGEDSPSRVPRWGWAVAVGVVIGWAADTKLTGWFLPLPLLAWSALGRDRRGLLTLGVSALVAPLVLYAFNPPWWGAPLEGLARFLRSNLTRSETIPIPVRFLGTVYNTPIESLPWYNTLVWTAIATPVVALALALVGTWRSMVDRSVRGLGTLIVGNWLFLLALRALPHTPGHDGTRQFLPAFGLLALAAGLGAGWMVARWGRWGRAVVVAGLVEGIASVALMMPVPLSYASPLVGGLPGATALGMEPTYFWDALTDDAIKWLNAHSSPQAKIVFATNPTSWMYLQRAGRLPHVLTPENPGGPFAWYVVQNRPGAFRPGERALIRQGRPSHVVTRWGVPLVWVFPFDEAARFLQEEGRGR
jgi:4-amino-4-deoxy-L-arabinose transferase-like glycosyltransferase